MSLFFTMPCDECKYRGCTGAALIKGDNPKNCNIHHAKEMGTEPVFPEIKETTKLITEKNND